MSKLKSAPRRPLTATVVSAGVAIAISGCTSAEATPEVLVVTATPESELPAATTEVEEQEPVAAAPDPTRTPTVSYAAEPTDIPPLTPTIPPTPTDLPNTTPGSVLEVGQTWEQDGLKLVLTSYDVHVDGIFWYFDVFNDTGTDLLLDLEVTDINMIDSRGIEWGPPCTDLDSINGRLCRNWSGEVRSGGSDDFWISYRRTNAMQDTEIKAFTLHITRLSRISDAKWFVQIRDP
jgi:hypothetical protein